MKIDVKMEDHKDEIKAAMKEQLMGALEAIGSDAASTASYRVPVDTGNLKNSISYAVDGETSTVYIGTNVEYAVYHELGTGIYAEGGGGRQTPWFYEGKDGKWHITQGVRAKHFLQYGVTAHQDEYAGIIREFLQG